MIKYCNFHIVNKYKPPDHFDRFGTKYWYDDNRRYNRDFDLPAVVYNNGSKCWYKHDKRYRVNPITKKLDINYPAMIFLGGTRIYYKNGIRYKFEKKENKWIEYRD